MDLLKADSEQSLSVFKGADCYQQSAPYLLNTGILMLEHLNVKRFPVRKLKNFLSLMLEHSYLQAGLIMLVCGHEST
jgi:hypothetical protein